MQTGTGLQTIQPEELAGAFGQSSLPIIDRWLEIGGVPVLLRFAGEALVPLVLPALAHLVRPPGRAAQLTVSIWDSESTGLRPPPLPTVSSATPAGTIYLVDRPPFAAVGRPRYGSLSALDLSTAQGWHWVEDAASVPFGDVAGPLRPIFQRWAAARGIQLVHGGAVGFEEGGVLLVGKGGSGKSTTSLSCMQAGMDFAGDDHVLIEPGAPPRVRSLYSACKLHPDHARRHPGLMPAAWNAARLDVEKAVGFVHEEWPDRTSAGFPLRAVLLPRVVAGPESRVIPASRSMALAALAPSTIFQLAGSRPDALRNMAGIVRSVPSFVLECGSDLAGVAATVAELLDELS